MMPVIRITDEIYLRLESLAKGFDTPAGVIERLLDERENVSNGTLPTSDTKDSPPHKQSTSKSKITKELAKDICRIGDRVYAGSLSRRNAIEELVEMGMHGASASQYLKAYESMLAGTSFTRPINYSNLLLMSDHILDVHGRDAYHKAVEALRKYQEGNSSRVGARKLLDKVEAKLKSLAC